MCIQHIPRLYAIAIYVQLQLPHALLYSYTLDLPWVHVPPLDNIVAC